MSGVRWGVVGTGAIATRFVHAMRDVPDGTIVAVGSRTSERAAAFAAEHGIERAHAGHAALATDPDVDAVYVATPNHRHVRDAVAALRSGKHVLCEKPLALNANEAREIVRVAREERRFAMEAIWSRFLPAYRILTDLIASGRIGEPLLVEADLGWRVDVDPTRRIFDPAVGGGSLLDLGIYPVQLAFLVLGRPDHVVAQGTVGETGVDEMVAAILHHPGGRLGVVKSAWRTPMACTARVAGTAGTIDLPAFMHCPTSLTVHAPDGREERLDAGFTGDGLRFQVDEVHRCLAAGLLESDRMPLDESVAMAETLDDIRGQIGLRFPGE